MSSILPFKDRDRAAAGDRAASPRLDRRHLEELLERSPAVMGLMTGPEHRWSYVNPSYVQVTGRSSAADFVGKTVRESLPELEGQGFFELLDEVYRKGIPFIGREMKLRLDRSITGQTEEVYFDFIYQPTRDGSGQVEGILVHAVEVTPQVMARKAVELSEERLRAIVETTPECVKVVGPDGTLLHMNSAGLTMVGADCADQVIGKNVYDLIVPEDREKFREFNERVCRGERGSLQFDINGLLGVRRHMETDAAPLKNADGTVVQLAVTRDITPRDEVEKSQRRLAAIVESSEDAIASKDLEGIITNWNKSAERLFGYKAEEIIGQPVTLIIPPELHDDEPQILEKIRRGERIEPFQTVRLHKNGKRIDVSLTVSPVRDDKGKIMGAAKIVRDITRQKKLEEAALRLAAIVESSGDAIASKDLNGTITSWNRSAEKLFGYKAEEIIGKPVTLIIPPELHHDEHTILSKIRRGEKIEHFETIRLHKNGEKIEVSLTISPVKDENGKVIGAAKIIRNITESNKIERAWRTTEKLAAAGRMAATVAHEINNPLEAVTNLVYLAKRDLGNSDRVAGYLEMASRELDRVAHITRQTLGFYRDTSSPVRLNVTETLDDLLLLYEKRFESRKIKVVRQYAREVEITALAGEVRQAFSNLITNAIDAMPDGGTLVLRISKSYEWNGSRLPGARVTVLDTGSGIEPRHRKNIFQPFFTTKADVGTGLGLWITRGIVEKHGGAIHVKSKTGENDHGTAFSIFLPMEYAGNSPEKSSVLDMPSNVTSTGKVLQ